MAYVIRMYQVLPVHYFRVSQMFHKQNGKNRTFLSMLLELFKNASRFISKSLGKSDMALKVKNPPNLAFHMQGNEENALFTPKKKRKSNYQRDIFTLVLMYNTSL